MDKLNGLLKFLDLVEDAELSYTLKKVKDSVSVSIAVDEGELQVRGVLRCGMFGESLSICRLTNRIGDIKYGRLLQDEAFCGGLFHRISDLT